MSQYVLVLYYSAKGTTEKLAQCIARGVVMAGLDARLRCVPRVSAVSEQTEQAIPNAGAPYCDKDDLHNCAGLIMGSPTRFGNMAAPLKYFIDDNVDTWLSGKLVDKPFGLFTSTSTLHGGQESTLLSMALPLIHQGMIYCGIPFTEASLHDHTSSGTPYGASHLANDTGKITANEKQAAQALGKRVASIAAKLTRD